MDALANDEFEVNRYYSDDDDDDEDDDDDDINNDIVEHGAAASLGLTNDQITPSEGNQIKKSKKRKRIEGFNDGRSETVSDTKINISVKGTSTVSPSFTTLGDVSNSKRQRVRRQLPAWLANPDIVSIDYTEDQLDVDGMKGLNVKLVNQLKKEGICKFFPVQRQVIPCLMQSNEFRPKDVCVSAPTGSGKTLAFVLPIVHSLMARVVPRVRALIVLPVQDLAAQVARVFSDYACGLQVTLLSAQRPFAQEQSELVRRKLVTTNPEDQYHSMADIVVATPGRLVDHLERTEGFSLQYLRYLVIDEADRVMEELQNDWLTRVERAVYKGWRKRTNVFCVQTFMEERWMPPLQKLLFSATLSQNPEQLERLNLFEPKLFSCIVKIKQTDRKTRKNDFDRTVDDEKFVTPVELEQGFIMCEKEEVKPKMLLHMLGTSNQLRALVFTKSVSHTHVLALLLNSYGLKVGELSSKVSSKRQRALRRFEQKEINVLVCSDALARGIDIESGVDVVYSYDCPQFPRTYIHRVGRTARAGKRGKAITFVTQKERKKFGLLIKNSHQESFMKEIKVNKMIVNEKNFEKAEVRVQETMENNRKKVADKRKGPNKKKKLDQKSLRVKNGKK